jgi:hypothetical protein
MANEFKIKKGLIVTGASGGTVVDIQGSQGQLFSVTDDLSGSIFAVSDISGVPIFDVNSSGVSYFDGDVGIGTSSPAAKLEITGTAEARYLQVDAIAGFAGISSTMAAMVEFNNAGDGNNVTIKTNNSVRTDAAPFSVWTQTNSRFLIRNDGNVGINTASPSKKLEVAGSFKLGTNAYIEYGGVYPYTITTANTAGVGNLVFSAGLGSAAYESRIDLQGTNTAGVAGITLSTASTPRMVVTADGNVGIGITGPNAKLQVDDGAIKTRNTVSSQTTTQVRRNINIASYDGGGATSTGMLIIETPVMTTGAMATFKISGWQYDESWDLTVSGYLRFGTGRGWQQIGGAILTGNPPFDIDEVRLCYDDTANIFYIILGDASTFWDYYASIVINADSYYQDSIPTTGWDMSVATADPTGLSSIVTLTNIAEYGSSNAIIPGSVVIGSHGPYNGRLNVQEGDAEMIFSSASSARPWLRLKHNIAPADGEEVGLLDFNGFNDADQDTRYAIFTAIAEDVSDGTEDGSLTLMTMKAGTLTTTLTGRSGKVGIANANPAQALDVTGKIRVTDDLIMAQQNGRIDYDNNVSTGALRFFSTSGGTERMRLSSSGDVLIGDTSRLNAYGDAFTTLSLVSRKSGDDASILELRGARSQNNGNQNSMIQFWNETSTATEVGRISSIQGGDVDDGQITFMTADGGSLGERMRIGPDGIIKFNDYNAANNIGTPTYLLGVRSDGQVVKTTSSPGTSTATSLYDLIPNGAFTTTYAFTSTAGVYAEVMSGNDVITSTGTYTVQMVVNDFAVGGTQYDEKYSGVMSWHAGSTNDAGVGSTSEITLHRSGHAGNHGITYLRTRETTNADNNELKLEIMCNKTYTGASNVVFKFVKLI